MKAAFARVPFEVEIKDIPVPIIGPDEVLVKVAFCGICGTDLHYARDLAKDRQIPIGHEFSGMVEKVGSNVSDYISGESVIVENHTYCGVCANCKNGQPVYCTNLYVVTDQPCLAEYVRVHKTCLHRYDGIAPAAAALAEPLTVALDLVEEAGVPIDSNVAVFGPGPIGLMAVRVAKYKGAGKMLVTGHSHSKARLSLAAKLGADRVVAVDEEDLFDVAKREFSDGFERIFVTSPPPTIPHAFQIARFGAVVVYNGIDFESNTITFDANAFHFKRLQLRATHSIPNLRFPIAIDLLKRNVIDPEQFITHTFRFGELSEALRTAENDKENVIKVMIAV